MRDLLPEESLSPYIQFPHGQTIVVVRPQHIKYPIDFFRVIIAKQQLRAKKPPESGYANMDFKLVRAHVLFLSIWWVASLRQAARAHRRIDRHVSDRHFSNCDCR